MLVCYHRCKKALQLINKKNSGMANIKKKLLFFPTFEQKRVKNAAKQFIQNLFDQNRETPKAAFFTPMIEIGSKEKKLFYEMRKKIFPVFYSGVTR